MTINLNRIISIGLGLVIVLYGTFGKQLWPFYQSTVESLLFGSVPENLTMFLKGKEDGPNDIYSLGRYFIYYPSYLLLHSLLISSLLWDNSRRLRCANAVFFAVLTILAVTILFSYVQHFDRVYDVFMNLMSAFLNMPLILFIVEGGRILANDIDKGLILKNAEKPKSITSTPVNKMSSRKRFSVRNPERQLWH